MRQLSSIGWARTVGDDGPYGMEFVGRSFFLAPWIRRNLRIVSGMMGRKAEIYEKYHKSGDVYSEYNFLCV